MSWLWLVVSILSAQGYIHETKLAMSCRLTLSIFSWACCWNFLKLFSVDTELETDVEFGTPGEPAEPKLDHDVGLAFESCSDK
jgi:hypothetical protein